MHFDARPDDSACDEDAEPSRHGAALLSVLVPVFNEEGSIQLFVDAVNEAMRPCPDVRLEFVFVNDGSSDTTLQELLRVRQTDGRIHVVDLSRNFGKEAALTAAIDHCTGDIVVPMDVDLQDPPGLLPLMVAKWREGYDVVLAKRRSRQSDTALKRLTAAAFYRLHNALSHPEIVENVGDFRLMDRSVIEALRRLPESRRFMKGLFAWVGFRNTIVGYDRPARQVGHSKFNGWRLWNLALEGVTSFTTVPLRMWTYIGGTVAFAAFAYGTYLVLRTVVRGVDVPGYASLFVAVAFLGGLQLVGIGVLGEYLGRTYMEAKNRPVYVVRRVYDARTHLPAASAQDAHAAVNER
jgi:polyisoprenyl-phosphate glycosyltransferase